MNMRNALLLFKDLAICLLIAGCGGGSTTGIAPAGPAQTTVTGVASKGIIKGGTVKIYAPAASGDIGGKILLATTATDNSGRFSAAIGSYKGMVLLEVSGSLVYTNEATGIKESIGEAAPLRAVVVIDNAGDAEAVTLSPLSELATRKALSGSFLTENSIRSANTLLSNLFQFDIIAVQPVEPAIPAINAATQGQRDYTIALAAIAKLAASAGSLSAVLDSFSSDLAATSRLSAGTAIGFRNAAAAFLSDSAHNQTGMTALSRALSDVGNYTGVLYLATQGGASAPIGSIQMTLVLPAGVTIKKGADGEAMVAVSGAADKAAATGKNYIEPDTLILAIISSPGFALGEFAAITYIAEPGVIPVASDFKVTYSKVTGFDGTNDFDLAYTIAPVLR